MQTVNLLASASSGSTPLAPIYCSKERRLTVSTLRQVQQSTNDIVGNTKLGEQATRLKLIS